MSAFKVLEDFGHLQPVPEAGQALVSDLLAALVRNDLSVLLNDHQLGDGSDVVPLLELAGIQTDVTRLEQDFSTSSSPNTKHINSRDISASANRGKQSHKLMDDRVRKRDSGLFLHTIL